MTMSSVSASCATHSVCPARSFDKLDQRDMRPMGTLATMSVQPSVPPGSEDPTRPAPEQQGRVVVVTWNHIGAALTELAAVVGRPTVVLDHREGHTDPATWLDEDALASDDALVVCDHD